MTSLSGITLDTLVKRLAAAAAGVLLLAWGVFSIMWGFANGAATRAEFPEAAEQAVALSPADPQTHFTLAVLLERSFEPGDFERALAHFERAAELAPHDFRIWLDLGRAYDRRGETARAEAALRYALSLAPNYAVTQWTLGNSLLRHGKTDEGFTLIRAAAASDAKYTEPGAALAWQISGGDMAAVRAAVGDAPRLTAALALLLTREKRFDEAAALWTQLPQAERRGPLAETGRTLLSAFTEARRFRDAALLAADTVMPGLEQGKVNNGGFESAVMPTGAPVFDWQIANGQNPQIVLTNASKASGNNSLLMVFNAADRAGDIRGIAQTIAVEPGRQYTLSFSYRAELDTALVFKWLVTSANTGMPIAKSDPIATRTDWRRGELAFSVPADADGITISFIKDGCGSISCTAAGNLWFDDIALTAR